MEALRRVGAIGDVHCEDERLEVVLGHLRALQAEVTLCVGDIVDGKGDVNLTCERLQADDVLAVAGNHERWLLAGDMRTLEDTTFREDLSTHNLAWLRTLPVVRRLPTVAGPMLLCHGIGEDDMAYLKPDTRGYGLQALDSLRELMLDPEVDFMVGGHTHERMVRRFQGLTVVNAGTIHRDYDAGFILMDFQAMEVRCFDLDGLEVRDAGTLALPPPAPLP